MGTTLKAISKHNTPPDYVQATEAAAALVVGVGELKIYIGSSRLTKPLDVVEQLRACADAIREANAPIPLAEGSDLVTNGAFAADTDWTKGTGWTIAAGVASSDGSQAGDADLTQDIGAVTGETYEVTFTVSNYSAGNVTPVVGDTEGTDRAADGTFVENIVAGAGADIDIRADLDFIGDIDNVSVLQVGGFEVVATLEEGLATQDVVITNQAALPTFTETQVAILLGSSFVPGGGTTQLVDVHLDALIDRAIEDILIAT